jgi:hypothetical protein
MHQQIVKAMDAHADWKLKLFDIISSGTFDVNVEDIKADNYG